jgi:hypothetical protein
MEIEQYTKQVIERAKQLQQFTVHVPVKKGWLPNGSIPYDLMVIKNTAHIRVYDISEQAAIKQVQRWMESMDEDQ